MNKKMRMFIIYIVFALIISCKNYAISKDLKNLEQNVEGKVKGFLEAKKEELSGSLKKLGGEVSSKGELEAIQDDEPQGEFQKQVAQDVNNENQELEELNKKIEDLKKKLEKTNNKTTLVTYSDYEKELKSLEEELKKLEEKLKDEGELKKRLEEKKTELEKLEKELKEKKENRKKALENAKTEFEQLQSKVENVIGQTYGHTNQNQGGFGQQAWQKANQLGLNGSYPTDDDTGNIAKNVINGALQKIEKELKEIDNNLK
ncbi:hypothetical protein [Borreliella afzelii]|uniref:hypothetical protein n=1 Tax=Borreliella afzelii TaxID=29518 RepID=UPI003AF5A91A